MQAIEMRKTNLSEQPGLFRRLLNIPELAVGVAVIIAYSFFVILNRNMANQDNFILILRQASYTGLIAIGLIFLMLAGEIDLSTGATAGLCVAVAGFLIENGVSEWGAITGALVTSVLIGLTNSFIALKIGVPSFFATLSTSFIYFGLINVLLQAKWVVLFDKLPFLTKLTSPSPFVGIQWSAILFMGLVVVGDVLVRRTKVGAILSATGGNKRAAMAAGIDVVKVKMLGFVFVSLCAATAGLFSMGSTGVADYQLGVNWTLWVITIALVGGSSLSGGVGSILGGFLAAILIQIIQVGLGAAEIKTNAQGIVVGSIVILAAILDVVRRKAKKY